MISKKISFSYDLGIFQIVAFAVGPKVNISAHEPFKSGISVPYGPMVLPDIALLVRKPDIWRACLSDAGSKVWCT